MNMNHSIQNPDQFPFEGFLPILYIRYILYILQYEAGELWRDHKVLVFSRSLLTAFTI